MCSLSGHPPYVFAKMILRIHGTAVGKKSTDSLLFHPIFIREGTATFRVYQSYATHAFPSWQPLELAMSCTRREPVNRIYDKSRHKLETTWNKDVRS